MTKTTTTLINVQSIAASGTQVSTVKTLDDSLTQAIIYVKNNGASTSLTVEFFSSPDSAGTIKTPFQFLTLDATTGGNVGQVFLDIVPKYVWITAINNDAVNATTYTVMIVNIVFYDISNADGTLATSANLTIAQNAITAIKAKTDTIDWTQIRKMLVMAIGNHIGLVNGSGNPSVSIPGFGTAVFTVDANGNRTLTSITLV